jgi:hypothetical protein
MRDWLRCWLGQHDDVRETQGPTVYLRCLRCLRTTRGWRVA